MRAAGIVVSAVIMALVAAIFALHSSPIERFIAGYAEKAATAALTSRVSIGSLHIGIGGRIRCADISLTGTSPLGDSLRIGKASVLIDLPALLRRRIALHHIDLKEVRLLCGRGETGVLHVPFFPKKSGARPKKPGPRSPWKLDLGSVSASNINARYIDSALSIDASLSRVAATLNFHALDSFSVALSTGPGVAATPWWGGAIRTVDAEGTITARALFLKRFHFAADSADVRGRGAIAFRREGSWNVEVDARTQRNALCVLDRIPGIGRGGTLAAQARWQGTIRNPRLIVDASASDVSAGGIPVDSLHIDARYDSAGTLRTGVRIVTGFGAAAIQGTADFPGLMTGPELQRYDVDASLPAVALPELLQHVGIQTKIPRFGAGVSLGMRGRSFTALPDRLTLDVVLRDKEMSVRENRVVLQAGLSGRSWNVAASDRAGNMINAEGGLTGGDSVSGTFSSVITRPAAVARYFIPDTVGGCIEASGSFSGLIARLAVAMDVQGTGLAWRTATLDSLAARLRFRDNALVVDDARARGSGELKALLSGFGIDGFGGRYDLALRGRGTIDTPEVYATLAVQHPHGPQFHASALLLDAMYGRDTLRVNRLRVTGDSSAVECRARGTFRDPGCSYAEVTAEFERAGIGRALLSAAASLGRDSITATLDLSALSPRHVAPFLDTRLPLDGTLSLGARGQGALRNPEVSLDLDLRQDIDSTHSVVYRADLKLHDSLANARVRALAGGVTQPLTADASIPLSYTRPWSMHASIRDNARIRVKGDRVNVTEILAAFLPQVTARGTMSLDAEAVRRSGVWATTGTAGIVARSIHHATLNVKADSLRVAATFEGTERGTRARSSVSARGVTWQERRIDSLRGAARYVRDTVRIDTLLAWIGGGSLFASGIVPVTAFDTLRRGSSSVVRFSGDALPLVAIGSLGDGIVPRSGTVSADGSVAIVRGRPVIRSAVSIRDFGLQVVECAPAVGPISADIRIAGDTLIVQSLTGSVGKSGVFSGKGILRLGDTLSSRFSFSARDCRLRCTDIDAGIQSLALDVADSANMFVISGDIDLAPSRYATYLSFNTLLDELDRPRPVAEERPNPFLERVRLRTTLRLNRNVTIETNLGRVVVDGRLAVVGNLKSTGAIGTIEVVEGHVYYLDRKFFVQNGSLRFRNPYAISPEIDLAATASVTSSAGSSTSSGIAEKTYEITLRVTGNMERPSLTLTADDPSLRPAQIVSLLTFGTIQGDVGADMSKRVETIVKQQLAGFGTRKLEQWLNIESLNVEPVGKQDAVVTAVKRLSPRLTVSYQTTLENVSKQKATASYRLLPFLYVDGTGDEDGVGADLRLRWSR